MLIAATEPEPLRALGHTSNRAEEYGADILWVARNRVYGVQRKELGDLLSSAEDGRLGEQVMRMQALDRAFLVVEGQVKCLGPGGDGPLVLHRGAGREWTGRAVRGLLWSVMERGVMVDRTNDLAGTVAWVKGLEEWSQKDKHTSLGSRGKGPRDVLGTRDVRAEGIWLLTGLPGIGPEMAARVWDHNGGKVLGLRDGVDLEGVPGMGKVRIEKIRKVLG